MQNSNMTAERRGAIRVKTFQPAELVGKDGDPQRVHLLNLSAGGAMIYGRSPPGIGAEVRLQGPIASGAGRVAWRKDNCFGITFERAVPEDSIVTLIREQRELMERAAARLRARAALQPA